MDKQRETNEEEPLFRLFANYLRAKIEEGAFPKDAPLPPSVDFMRVFKLSLPDILKAFVELENEGVLKASGNSTIAVARGQARAQILPFDVRSDVKLLFERLELLENKAMDEAWPRIDRTAARAILCRNRDASLSKRIWLANRGIHRQLLGNCGDMELASRLDNLQRQLEFFRRLYLDSIPHDEIRRHAFAIEAIMHAFSSCDLDAAHFQLSSYIAQFRERLLDIFKDCFILTPKGLAPERLPCANSEDNYGSQCPVDQREFAEKESEMKKTAKVFTKEENLKRLARTPMILNFVKSKKGSWNHQDWLGFLAELKVKGFEPIDADQVGLLLEERKAQYWEAERP